jgi:hypothetical protein
LFFDASKSTSSFNTSKKRKRKTVSNLIHITSIALPLSSIRMLQYSSLCPAAISPSCLTERDEVLRCLVKQDMDLGWFEVKEKKRWEKIDGVVR